MDETPEQLGAHAPADDAGGEPKAPAHEAAEPVKAPAKAVDPDRELAGAPITTGNAAKIAAAGLFFHACGLLAAALLASYGLMAVVAQAIIAEWGLTRLGVQWSTTEAGPSPAARAGRGVALGIAAAIATTGVLVVTRAGHFEQGGLVPTTLGVGVLSAGAGAMWSELFFRGLVLRLTENVKLLSFRVAAGGLASFAAAFSAPGATLLEATVAGLFGAVMACLWLHDRGAFLAVGAHAGWLFATRAVFRGGLFELAGSTGWLGGLGSGPFSGGAAALVLSGCLVLGVTALRRGRAPSAEAPAAPNGN